jgi:ketosteroid isomerase-like protein
MPRQNVEVVRRNMDAFNRGDVEAFCADFSPSARLAGIRAQLETEAIHTGPDAPRDFLAAVAQTWTEISFDLQEVRGPGSELVAVGWLRGTFRDTGLRVDQRAGVVYRFEAGKIQDCRAYSHVAEALEAAGLSTRAQS